MRRGQKLYNENGVQVLLFPLDCIYISQGENGQYSHQGTYNIDFLGYNSNGRVYSAPYYRDGRKNGLYKIRFEVLGFGVYKNESMGKY